jgi:hypothetical protein
MNATTPVRIWILVSAWAALAGWLLSAVGALNRTGYAVCLGLTLLAAAVWRRRHSPARTPSQASWRWPKIRRRWRRPLPLAFALLALLALLGGLLYPPSNHTGLTYRTPRVLQWLSQEQWFWIHTPNYRMNNRACGFEWLSAPWFLFTRSDRLLFLLNYVPFVLVPGLVYSVFTRLGVKPRVAEPWMWLLPAGYTFLLQAGSIGNDTFPTVYALAAIDFALRGWTSKRPSDFGFSLLSAALLTGAKASNLPLLLPWFVLMLPLAKVWLRHPGRTAVFGLVAAAISFLPTAFLNQMYCGDWSGLKLERAGMDMREPVVGIWGNALILLANNLVPPLFPQAGSWNRTILDELPRAMVDPLNRNFENGFHQLPELQTEEWAGLGFGVSLLWLVSLGAALLGRVWRRGAPSNPGESTGPVSRLPRSLQRLVLWSPWIALLAYCMKSGMVTPGRLISPYYPLLLAWVLAGPVQAELVRRRWWKMLTWLVMAMAVPVLGLTPARPLWPARTILSRLQQAQVAPGLVARAEKVYGVYAARWDSLSEVRALLPPDAKVVGFLADGDDMDISFWRPLGSRRVEHFLIEDPPQRFRQKGVEYVVLGGAYLSSRGVRLEDWLEGKGGQLIGTRTVTLKVAEGPQPWHVARLKPSP